MKSITDNPKEEQSKIPAAAKKSLTIAGLKTGNLSDGDGNKMQVLSDNAAGVGQLKAMQEMANQSPIVRQLKKYEHIANQQNPLTAQLKKGSAPTHLIQKNNDQTGLPVQLKMGMEALSGQSMNDVKVHYNSDKPAQLQAHAFAQGTEIHLAQGQEKHLPHEAWHVVQQKEGRVKPTIQLQQKVNVNDDKKLEREADVMGEKSKQLGQSHSEVVLKKRSGKDVIQQQKGTATGTVQRLEANKPAPSLEEQASVMASSHGDMEGTKNTFFNRAIEIAVETINTNKGYVDLKQGLSGLSFDYREVKTETEYTQFWNELSVKTPSISSGIVGSLRSSSRHKALQEAANTTPYQHVSDTYSVVKNHLIELINNDEALAPLLKTQFEAMAGLGLYNVLPGKELDFCHKIGTAATGVEETKQAYRGIMTTYSLSNEEKITEIKSNSKLRPLIRKVALQLLEDGVIIPPGGVHQIYTVLLKNASGNQLNKLNEIYGTLEEYGDRAQGVVLKKVAGFPLVKKFLEKNNNMEIGEFDFHKPSLTNALMGTLFVARLLDPKMVKQYPVEEETKGAWKNGGNLADDVVVEKSNKESEYEAFYDMDSVEDKIKKADEQLKMLVSKSVLSQINRPQVKVDESFGHRAFQHKDHISVSISDQVDVIVHEAGHYIEINNPDLWYDVSLLLHSRHQEPKGPNAQSGSIGEQENNPQMKGRYRGDYPVTGKYTSKIYETEGATEVTSMTMEYLSTPEKARELIENDPFQALLVLRKIQPDDPDLKNIYASNEKYLPHKNPEERQRLLKRIKQFEQELSGMGLRDRFKAQLENLDTMGLNSLRTLEDQMEALPTGERIMQLIEKYPQLADDFDKDLTAAVTYPIYKLNQLLLSMEVASYNMR